MVYCKNCIRWYSTKADQCEIPSCDYFSKNKGNEAFYQAVGIDNKRNLFEKEGLEFIKSHMRFIHGNERKIYGKPSELNKNNDCYFYKTLSIKFLIPFVRFFYC